MTIFLKIWGAWPLPPFGYAYEGKLFYLRKSGSLSSDREPPFVTSRANPEQSHQHELRVPLAAVVFSETFIYDARCRTRFH